MESASTSELPGFLTTSSSMHTGGEKKFKKNGVRNCSVASSIVLFAAWNALSLDQKLYPSSYIHYFLFLAGIIVSAMIITMAEALADKDVQGIELLLMQLLPCGI